MIGLGSFGDGFHGLDGRAQFFCCVTEIAVGWYTLAFAHLAGHACFRLLQFLSAPNVLHDLHGLEDTIGGHESPDRDRHFRVVRSDRARRHLFLIALERGFLDSILDRVVIEPFTRLAGLVTRLDQWLCDAVLPARLSAAADKGDQLGCRSAATTGCRRGDCHGARRARHPAVPDVA